MKQRLLIFLSVMLAIFLSAGITAAQSDAIEENINWDIDKNGTLTFSGNGIIPENGPWLNEAKKVKAVVFEAGITGVKCYFKDFSALTSISFGPDITDLQGCHFESKKVKTISLQMKTDCYQPNIISLTSHPTDIIVSDDSCYIIKNDLLMTEDEKEVIYAFGKGAITVPDGVTVIRQHAFSFSPAKEIILPNSLEKIEERAFANSESLLSITIPRSVTEIGDSAFKNCKLLKAVIFDHCTLHVDDHNYWYIFSNCNSLTRIELPCLDAVPNYMFAECSNLQTVIIAAGTKQINEGVFRQTKKLKEIYIPESITNISEDFFDYSSKPIIYSPAGSFAETYAASHSIETKQFNPITGIELSEQKITIAKGKAATVTASIYPTDASIQSLNIYSSNEAIATIKNGKVTAVGTGECDLIFEANDGSGIQAICHVSAIQMIQSLQSKDKKVTIPYGGSHKAEIILKPEDATNKELAWSSSDTSVCIVNENGNITATGAGDCEIVFSTTDGSQKEGKIAIHVPIFEKAETNYTISKHEELTIPVDLHGISASYVDHKSSSTKNFLYSFDNDGLHIYPILAGNANITLTSKINKNDKTVYKITVAPEAEYNVSPEADKPVNIILMPDKSIINPGDKITFTYYLEGDFKAFEVDGIYGTYTNGNGFQGLQNYTIKEAGTQKGTITVDTKGNSGIKRIGIALTVIDLNGNAIKKENLVTMENGLKLSVASDTLRAKIDTPVTLYSKSSGGTPPYTIEYTIYRGAKFETIKRTNVYETDAVEINPGSVGDKELRILVGMEDAKGNGSGGFYITMDIDNKQIIKCDPDKLFEINNRDYCIAINRSISDADPKDIYGLIYEDSIGVWSGNTVYAEEKENDNWIIEIPESAQGISFEILGLDYILLHPTFLLFANQISYPIAPSLSRISFSRSCDFWNSSASSPVNLVIFSSNGSTSSSCSAIPTYLPGVRI